MTQKECWAMTMQLTFNYRHIKSELSIFLMDKNENKVAF